ncbi:MAG: zinc ABC transporter substrate-binding protein [Myxococcales bacterium]|nr:zinc ABC transporter substrate-binding protein [Myxococcales bacterium]MCB9531838.1 zinc ABC transporter substrate-binding protein [Myxococcales bacterium]
MSAAWVRLFGPVVVAALLASWPGRAEATVRVVATTGDLGALVAAVGGEAVRVDVLAAPTEDPHFVDPRPSFVVTLSRADLLVVNGAELEVGWLPPVLAQSRNAAIASGARGYLDAAATVQLLQVPAGGVDRSMGDVHSAGNPHFSCDARRGVDVGVAIASRLAELDPGNAAIYAANAARLSTSLTALAESQRARFAALSPAQRQVVSYHESLTYLFDWLGLTQVATVEPRPGVPPSPARVAEVLGVVRDTGARVLVQEEYYPTNDSRQIAQLAGASLVVLESQTRFSAGQTYEQHVRAMTDALFAALSGP